MQNFGSLRYENIRFQFALKRNSIPPKKKAGHYNFCTDLLFKLIK